LLNHVTFATAGQFKSLQLQQQPQEDARCGVTKWWTRFSRHLPSNCSCLALQQLYVYRGFQKRRKTQQSSSEL
jgi:hypothetical protein